MFLVCDKVLQVEELNGMLILVVVLWSLGEGWFGLVVCFFFELGIVGLN